MFQPEHQRLTCDQPSSPATRRPSRSHRNASSALCHPTTAVHPSVQPRANGEAYGPSADQSDLRQCDRMGPHQQNRVPFRPAYHPLCDAANQPTNRPTNFKKTDRLVKKAATGQKRKLDGWVYINSHRRRRGWTKYPTPGGWWGSFCGLGVPKASCLSRDSLVELRSGLAGALVGWCSACSLT